MLHRWATLGAGARIHAAADTARIMFDIILQTMLSGGDDLDVEEASREITVSLETLGRPTIADILGLPPVLKKLTAQRGGRAATYLRTEVGAMIARRRIERPGRGDLVDLLMQAKDPETARTMTNRDLGDNLITFIGAGHETTTLSLTRALFLLSQHPRSAARVRAEVAAVAGDAPITQAHMERLTYTRQVLLEAMRLYPPVAALPRQANRDTTLAGQAAPKHTFVIMPISALYRRRARWANPDVFDPDRFAPEHGGERQHYQYRPFGARLRICIGIGFTIHEGVAVLATLMRGANLAQDSGHAIRPLVRITLRP